MKTTIPSLLMMLLLASCSTYVPVKKVLPPEIVVPESEPEFLFLSRFNPESLDFSNENKIEVFYLGHESYQKGLKQGFDTSAYFQITLSDTIFGKGAPRDPGVGLDPDLVARLCKDNEDDYLLSLDAYNLYFDQEVEVEEYEDGSKNRTAYYDLVVETYITIYNSDGEVFDKLKDENRMLYDDRSVISGLLAIGPSMGKANEEVVQLSKDLGAQFIQKFYPLTIFEEREFYNYKQFDAAYKDYLVENWQGVESKLVELTHSEKNVISGRAAYNLAILYENLGRYEEMEYWYEKALDKLHDSTPYLPSYHNRGLR